MKLRASPTIVARLAGAGQEWKKEENSSIADTVCGPATDPAHMHKGEVGGVAAGEWSLSTKHISARDK